MQSNNKKINKLAHAFFAEEWDDEKIRIHSECVIEACLNMAKNTDLKEEVFIIAGWVHDIGIKIDKDKHHELSLDFLDKFLGKYPEFEPIKEELKDCILNHRTEGKPKTLYGLIFKTADKVALRNKKWLAYKGL